MPPLLCQIEGPEYRHAGRVVMLVCELPDGHGERCSFVLPEATLQLVEADTEDAAPAVQS